MRKLLAALLLTASPALAQHQIRIPAWPTNPLTCTAANFGGFYIDGTTFRPYICDGTSWKEVIILTPTDDTVPVGSGTVWENKALPNCTDSAGNHLNYTVATNTWSCGTSTSGAAGAHNLLSTSHGDTTAAAAVRGDALRGSATATWERLALGTADRYLKAGATDLLYSTLAASGTGACTDQFVSTLNADAAPTCTTPALASGGTGLSVAADDTVLLSNGSAWEAKAITNCTAGALLYTAATNTFSCGAGAGITGSGTTNNIAKFTAATAVGNSGLTDTSTGVVPAAFTSTTVTTGGFVSATPGAATYGGVTASGTDTAGGSTSINAGAGTGTGNGGSVTIKVAPELTTGTTAGTLVAAATFAQNSMTLGGWDTISGALAPAASTIRGVDSAGTDIAGGALTTGTGQGTGNAAAPAYTIQVAPNAGTGSSANALKTVFTANGSGFTLGNVTINTNGTAPAPSSVQGYNAAGTNVAGGYLALRGGTSTGSAGGGAVYIQVSLLGAAGSGANALQTIAQFNGSGGGGFSIGDVNAIGGGVGNSSIYATNATSLTDLGGEHLYLGGGVGTGAGEGGTVVFRIAPPGATGTAQNARVGAYTFGGRSFSIGPWPTSVGGPGPLASVIAGAWPALETDKNGGNLYVESGIGTGTGQQTLYFRVAPAAATGSAYQNRVTAGYFSSQSFAFGGWTTVSGGAAPVLSTMYGINSAGTDAAGAALTIGTGNGTGSAAAPALTLQVAPNAGTGSSANALKTVFTAAGTSFTLGSVTINSGGTAPAASTVQGYNSAGTDIAGGALSINGGTGRGTGDGGAITFKVAPDLATGTTAGTLVTAGTINQTSVTFGAFSTVSGGTAPTASTYAGVHGVGTDIAGGAVSLDGGKGTGTGDGGAVTIKVAPDQATGTGVNPYVTAATINQTSVTLGNFTTVSGGTAPGASTYAGVNSAGTNIAGGSTTLQSGTGTGSGAVPNVVVKTPEILGTGTTTQTHIITSDHSQKSLAAADNADVALYTVTLATQDTGCGAHISWIYTVTDTADTSTHAGILICVFRNDDATVTGACADSGEVSIGTACGAGCDTNSVGVAGTTATVNMKFDNLLTQTGGLRYSVLNNTCPTFVRQ